MSPYLQQSGRTFVLAGIAQQALGWQSVPTRTSHYKNIVDYRAAHSWKALRRGQSFHCKSRRPVIFPWWDEACQSAICTIERMAKISESVSVGGGYFITLCDVFLFKWGTLRQSPSPNCWSAHPIYYCPVSSWQNNCRMIRSSHKEPLTIRGLVWSHVSMPLR